MNVFIIIMLNIFNAFLLVSMDTAVSLVYNIILGYLQPLNQKSACTLFKSGWLRPSPTETVQCNDQTVFIKTHPNGRLNNFRLTYK